MKKLFFLTLSLMAGFIASCGGGSGGAYSALFGDGPKALKPAQAQCTITVSDSNGNGFIDNADIQTALDQARTNNQDDVVCIPAGTYNITSTLTYNLSSGSSECGKKLTIRADGGSVILDGGNSVQILSIDTSNCSDDANGDITIEGITFQNGYGGYGSSGSGGGLYVMAKNANITFTNNTFSGNSAYYGSGGADVWSGSGSITFTNNTFSNNSAGDEGGGAFVGSDSGSITFTNNTFSGNSADHGGGVRVWSGSGSITFTNNTFSGNSANGSGGGAFVWSTYGSITFTSNTFSGNSADYDGGGVRVWSDSGSITFTNNTFSGNSANGSGGGAFVSSDFGSITLTNNTFSSNSAYYGGGGAFVSSDSGSITFTNNTFSSNSADHGGGADVLSDSGSITLTNNTFSGNSADYRGGGAYVGSDSGSITLTNNTFSSNSAYYQGGGAYVRLYYNAATLHFYNNILWNNTANAGGNDGDDLYVDNDGNNDNTASPVNLAHNLFSTTANPIDFSVTPQANKVYIRRDGLYNQNIANGCSNTGQYGNIQADPLFADADLRLQASSPAINAGCNNAPSIPNTDTDKDGNQRIVGTAVDMGAYEYQGQQQPQQYTLTVNKSGNGSGSISATGCTLSCTGNTCTCTANAGTQITLSASADQSSVFAGWSNGTGSASCTGTGQCTITLNQDSSITATFNLKQYTITASASPPEGGSITCTPNPVNHGQTATCTITANANYTLQSVGGTCGGTLSGNTYTTNAITSDCTVVANFSISISQYTLTVNKSGTGSGTVTSSPQGINCGSTCSANFDANTTVTLTATVSSGSTFAGWSGDCSSCGNNTTCQVSMTSAKTCTATFNPQQSGGGGGSGGGPIIIPPPEIQPPQTGPISDNATIPAPNQQGNISIQIEGATFIQSPTTITNIPPPPNNGATPYGAITFSAGLAQGQTQITVRITFPSIPQGAEFYKIIGNRYIRINPTVNGNTIIFVVVDNSELDANQQAGVISDPVVMVVPQSSGGTNQTGGGGGGGCSMGGTADASMLWLLIPPVLALARRLRRSA